MKAVIIGTDLIKTNSGELKLLEMNTNVGILSAGTQYLNLNALTQFITDNEFTELHILGNHKNFISNRLPYKQDSSSLWSILNEFCEQNNIEFFDYLIQPTSNTVPYIEDSDNKLILRLSYDASAFIDSEYTADKSNLITLINGKDYSVKSYIKDGIDTIGNDSFVYDGNEPNYIIKKVYTDDDRSEFPQVFVIPNEQELSVLKENLQSNEILQEFHHSYLTEDGKLSIIRSIDILYGSNLDTLHLGSYGVKHKVEIGSTNTIDSTNKISKVDRLKYLTYTSNRGGSLSYIIDSTSLILMGDGTQKLATEVVEGDVVKTVDIVDLPTHERSYKTSEWSGSLSRLVEESNITTTTISGLYFVEETMIFTKVTTANGTIWSDLPTSEILVKEDTDTIKFKFLSEFVVGEEIVFLDIQSETFIVDTIASIEYEFKTVTIGEMDVEPFDVFLPILDGGRAIIQHNGCKSSVCRYESPCPNWNKVLCSTCTPQQCAAK